MEYRGKPQGLATPVFDDQLPTAEFDVEIDGIETSSSSTSTSSLAAKAIRASSAYRGSSLSSAYSSPSSPRPSMPSPSLSPALKDSNPHEYISMKTLNEPKQGFWGVLARKAKSILDDESDNQPLETPTRTMHPTPSSTERPKNQNADERHAKTENPKLKKGLDAITSSINFIGGTIGNAVEEGITIVENRTAGIIQETRKHMRKKSNSSLSRDQAVKQQQKQPQAQADLEIQLKASRDVAMAMAAKAKLLLRELKTVKADLAFAKQRCAQLEEENRVIRENRDRGDNPEDDDLVRLQLETLLAEKARLAHENSIYARENRFLREVVEYHQLTMQDVVYLDERTEDVTEVYPITVPSSVSNPSSTPVDVPVDLIRNVTPDNFPRPLIPPGISQNAP